MNMQHLDTFCTVLNEKSMTAAAQKLFLTQPAVSLQIRNLEESLGVELLVRGVRSIKPTPQGSRLYDYAKKILNLVEQSKIAIQSMDEDVSGPIRVGTINSIGLHLVGPVFSLFLQNNNSVRLNLRYGEGSSIINRLEKGQVELAILPDAKKEFGRDPKDCLSDVIINDEMVLVAANSDPAIPNEITLDQFADRPVVLLSDEYPGFEKTLGREMRKGGRVLKPVFETANVGTLKRMVEAGLGWGFLPAHSIKKQIQTGRLKRVRVKDFKYTMDMICYISENHRNNPTAQVFLKALKQQTATSEIPTEH